MKLSLRRLNSRDNSLEIRYSHVSIKLKCLEKETLNYPILNYKIFLMFFKKEIWKKSSMNRNNCKFYKEDLKVREIKQIFQQVSHQCGNELLVKVKISILALRNKVRKY